MTDLHSALQRYLSMRKGLDVYLCVNPRGVMALVPQQLADLRQGGAGVQQFGGKAVAKNVGTLVRVAADAGALQCSLGDHRDRAAAAKADVGSKAAQEQFST